MTIEAISLTTVKITLTPEDLREYGLSYGTLRSSNIETKLLLSAIISAVRENGTAEMNTDRFFIEAFEQQSGGCIIYISAVPEKIPAKVRPAEKLRQESYLTVEIKNPQDLEKLFSKTWGQFGNFIEISSLYEKDGGYRLVAKTSKRPDRRFQKLIDENGLSSEAGEITAQVTSEHWNCIIAENALETLSERLSGLS